MTSCAHWMERAERPFNKNTTVIYKEECMYCFQSWTDSLSVCIDCYQAFCPEDMFLHKSKHPQHFCHVTVKRSEHLIQEPEMKAARVEIKEERVDYEYSYSCQCNQCGIEVDGEMILKRISESSPASIVLTTAWRGEDINVCQHSLAIEPEATSPPLQQCSGCDLTSGLWMCLTCGVVGCGRRQFDGSGGNGHASEHFDSTRHSVSVKIGTIKNALPDVYCYECDAMVMDPEIEEHVAALGLSNALGEKSMAELEVEGNARRDFSMKTEDGHDLAVVRGAVGLGNLGNSCYLNSILQSLYYSSIKIDHSFEECQVEPKDCLACQGRKIWNELQTPKRESVRPWMFKGLIGRGNAEFSSNRQQDAAEFLQLLFTKLPLISPLFSLDLQQTVTCQGCGDSAFTYSKPEMLHLDMPEGEDPIHLSTCLADYFKAEQLEGIGCQKCGGIQEKTRKYGLTRTPPSCLAVVLLRTVVNKDWVPCKRETETVLEEYIDLSPWIEEQRETPFIPDPAAMDQLAMMGFPRGDSEKVLKHYGNDLEASLNHLLSGLSLPGLCSLNEEDVAALLDIGFTREQAISGLKRHPNDQASAIEYIMDNPNVISEPMMDTMETDMPKRYKLTAFVSHKGSSLHCGHYIAHVRADNDQWYICNDERVVHVDKPDTSLAYLAIYTATE